MTLRFNTLLNFRIAIPFEKTAVFLMLLFLCPVISNAQTSMDDIKKEAKKLFEDDEFTKAYKLYAQLVANFPKEPEYNYRLGVCMIYSEPDKKKCIPYLTQAAANPQDAPKDVNFYLGKAYHINYQFNEAIRYYSEFKKTASPSLQKKLQVDREIKACNNGKFLLSNLSDLVVQSKKELNEADYFRSYDLKSIGGKLLVKPDDFKTSVDKKKKEKSVVFLPKGSNVVYFSSYGDSPDQGKDIYTAAKSGDGSFGKPQKVPVINTEFDEDYPFLHPDGKTLYFASKGHNSMGGYDIFKTTFDESANTWTQPVNLEFPINSPDDDFLFVTDSLERTAYFSTGRQSSPGKIDVLKINTERKPLDVLVIRGNVKKTSEGQGQASTFSVKNLGTDKMVGIIKAQENGDYNMVLPNGAKLLFSVETPGVTTQSQEVSLPLAVNSRPYKQTVFYDNGKLRIDTQFDEEAGEDAYLQYLKIIEEKAKLDVNEGKNTLSLDTSQTVAANGKNDTSVVQNSKKRGGVRPKIVDEETGSADPVATNNPPPAAENKPVDNKQLATMAQQEAAELKQEAGQLKKDAADALEAGKKQKIEAEKKLAEAEEAIKLGEGIENEEEKKNILGKAIEQKNAAQSEIQVAERILTYAQTLDNDAKEKQKESDLNAEYARELNKAATNKNNKESLARIEAIQKELNKTVEHKSESENLVNLLKAEIEQKEGQISTVEKLSADLRSNIEEIKTGMATTEAELANTRKKARKEELNQQLNNYKTDKEEREKELAGNDVEIARLNEELNGLKTELEITNKIKTEDIAKNTAPPAEVKPEAKPKTAGNTPIDNGSLRDKYMDKIAIKDINNKTEIEGSNQALNSYNKEIDQAIAKSKAALAKAKTPDDKQEITKEIRQLEVSKKQNNDQLAANKKLMQAANGSVASTAGNKTQDIAATYAPIKAESGADAVTKLEKLNNQLVFNDNENFDFNAYQNPEAQNLKVQADARINEAIARQKKLKEEIGASKEDLKNNPPTEAAGPPIDVVAATKEAEELHAKAQERFKESKTKTGAEKDKLLAESRAFDDQANEKHIAIARSTERENQANFEVNNENIGNLVKENKSSEADVAQAKQLNEEATVAYKKAIEIRAEASGLNNGAKLGIYSNAEEKEAEAILKQQQAVEILKKSNPDFTLKTPAAPSTEAPVAQGDLNSKLEKVNSGIDELATIKIESYQKLAEANSTEANEISNNIKTNQAVIDGNPRLKTDYIAVYKRLETSKKLSEESAQASAPGEKLSKLVASIKMQNEAIKELNALNKSVNQQVVTAGSNPATPVANEPLASNTGTNNSTEGENAGTTTTPPSGEPTGNNASQGTEETPPATLSEPVTVNKTDTSATQVLNYFQNKTANLKNQQANTQLKKSLNNLSAYEKDIAALDKQAGEPGSGNTAYAGQSSERLKSLSDSLTIVGEDLGTQSFKLRKEADTKTGPEKEELLKQAEAVDERSLDNNIDAANLLLRSNEMDVKANIKAILELLDKLAKDNPDLRRELLDKNTELQNLSVKANQLRDEANSLPNRAARLGALSNAEEKEAELIQKQNELLSELKKAYPDFVVKPLTPEEFAASETESPEQLAQKKSAIRAKQYTELTNVTNALSLEYEASKNNVPKTLSNEQQATKQNAEALNTESKNLLIRASKEKNENEKIKLLSQAATSGNEAVAQLNKIATAKPGATAVAKADPRAPKNANKNPAVTNPPPAAEVNPPAPPAANPRYNPAPTVAAGTLKVAGLEVVKGSAYNDTKPIPIDAKIEDGLVFRVQIGAFRSQLPNNTFRGLTPLNGESTPNGYFRYTAGNFNKVENANAVKNDLRGLGYSDAFVVAFYNGKRITLAEAFELLNKEGKTVDPNAPQSAGITANTNVPPVANPVPVEKPDSKELEKTEGLLFTIQIGVYNRQVSKQQLLGLRPVFTEQLPGGLFRYTAGIYNNADRLILDKKKVVDFGVRDAFVSAYLNGKKIAFAEAKTKAAEANTKMENENPVIFPEGGAPQANTPANTTTPANVKPFSNGVNNYPEASPENGIKTTEEGICFKVQVAAYSKQVPNDVAAKLSAIKSWPVENKQINGLYVYNIGNFSDAKYAKQLKEEALKVGLTDAFITVYKDGQKLYGTEAFQHSGIRSLEFT